MIRMVEALEVHDRMARARMPNFPEYRDIVDMGIAAQKRIKHADTYWVSSDMAQVITQAAKTMPDETFLPLDVPGPAGLILFQNPEVIKDLAKIRFEFDAISWFGTERGCHITVLRSDKKFSYVADKFIPFSMDHTDVVINSLDTKESTKPDARWYPYERQAKRAAIQYADKKGGGYHKADELQFMRLPKAFWVILEQEILRATPTQPDRSVRRRLQKSGSHLAASTVKVVTWRKVRYESKGGSKDVEWSHRWMVGMHWRNQWHPAKKVHRARIILPYEKGPKDKPLVLKRTVNVLVR